jgi:hypothetical protein
LRMQIYSLVVRNTARVSASNATTDKYFRPYGVARSLLSAYRS